MQGVPRLCWQAETVCWSGCLAGCLRDSLYLLTSPHPWLTASVTIILLMHTGSLVKSCFSLFLSGKLTSMREDREKKDIIYKVLFFLCSLESIRDYWHELPDFKKSGFGVGFLMLHFFLWGRMANFFGLGPVQVISANTGCAVLLNELLLIRQF